MQMKLLMALAAAMLSFGSQANAQRFPDRPMTMIIPFAAGGPTDVLGRVVAGRMSELLGQQVVVENITGAGGMTVSARVAKSSPDGYQFVQYLLEKGPFRGRQQSRMSQHGDSTGFSDGIHSLPAVDSRFVNIGRFAISKETVESSIHGRNDTFLQQSAGNMGPADLSPVGYRFDFREADVYTD